jgi:hypothetical protein
MPNPWNRSANWRREEKDPGAHIRSIVRTILEIVPGGVLRAGKTAFGEGRGWLLSVTDAGAGIVDIGDEANFLRFDGDDFTWHTPATELTADGTIAAVNLKIKIEETYTRPSRLEFMDGDQPCAQLVTNATPTCHELTTTLSNQAANGNCHTAVGLMSSAGEGGNAKVTLEAYGGAGAASALLELSAAPTESRCDINADLLALGASQLDLLAGHLQLHEIDEPAAPAGGQARLFLRDSGAGKTQLCIRFASGASQVLAGEA